MVGSGLQFSSDQNVQHAGDAVSVAGGAVSVIFAVCTADVNVLDSVPNLPPLQGEVPRTVDMYVSRNAPELLAAMKVKATQSHKSRFLSCQPRGAIYDLSGSQNTEALNEMLQNMNRSIGALLDSIPRQ